jgi:small ligand-binding sensory domain FIST
MEDLNSDLLLDVIQYLNLQDSSRLATSCRRFYYLVHQFRRLKGPELVTSASYDSITRKQRSSEQVVQDAMKKLQQAPNLVLCFNTPRSTLPDVLPNRLPKDAVVVGVVSGDIQVNSGKGEVEHESTASIMCASFPNASLLPFSINYGPDLEENIANFKSQLASAQTPWKAMIVYAVGDGAAFCESFVTSLQAAFPDMAIVGGICEEGYVSSTRSSSSSNSKEELNSMSIRQLRTLLRQIGGSEINVVEKSDLVNQIWEQQQESLQFTSFQDAVFGVVLGGDAPVKSMVSRGVTSITHGVPQPTSPFVVHSVEFFRPEDPGYLFRGEHLQPMHMIAELKNTETGQVLTAAECMTSMTQDAEFLGVKRDSHDGFELYMMSPFSHRTNSYLISTDGSPEQEESLQGAQIDFFILSGEACLEDMEKTAKQLREQTQGEQILGAVMFSCSGRGPSRGRMIPEDMADAKRFHKEFPNVPCLGFYANGEIGPMALAGNEKVFQTGRASVQGFTAVFCLFIVPVVERQRQMLDDCTENVNRFVATRLSAPIELS